MDQERKILSIRLLNSVMVLLGVIGELTKLHLKDMSIECE